MIPPAPPKPPDKPAQQPNKPTDIELEGECSAYLSCDDILITGEANVSEVSDGDEDPRNRQKSRREPRGAYSLLLGLLISSSIHRFRSRYKTKRLPEREKVKLSQ